MADSSLVESKPPMVIAFYSFKGGVGRSMAIVNVAEIFASWGYRVIVCDWDLEAPGLEQYLVDGTNVESFLASPGIIDLVREYKDTVARPVVQVGSGVKTPEPDPEFEEVGNVHVRRPYSYARELPGRVWGPRGWLRFLPSGRRDRNWEMRYNSDVRTLNWNEFYTDWAGGAYFEYIRLALGRIADLVLIDSRTGMTELGGVATHHLADVVLLFTAANRQNREGTDRMVASLKRDSLLAERGQRPVVPLPIASRIDTVTAARLEPPFMADFISKYSRLVPEEVGDPETFLRATRIPYVPEFSYEEKIVARMTRSERSSDLYNPYEALALGLERIGLGRSLLPVIEAREVAGIGPASTLPTPQTAVVTARLEGKYFIAYPASASDHAQKLLRALTEAEVSVKNLTPSEATGLECPSPRDILEAAERVDGYLTIVPADAEPAWLEAEINWMLRCQATKEGFRAMLLSANGFPDELPLRKRIATLRSFDFTSAQGIQRLIVELLPPQHLVPEGDAERILDGLPSPKETESRFFAGRSSELAALLERAGKICAAGEGALTLYGESGSGKSNLIWAGLVPAIRRGWIGMGSGQWLVAGCKIITDARTEITTALLKALPHHATEAAATGLEDAIRRLSATQRPLLLVVDSAQEIVAGTDSRNAGAVEEILANLRKAFGRRLTVIFGVRRDFFERLSRRFATWVREDLSYNVCGISSQGRDEFLRAAARLLGLQYEPGLLDVILREAEDTGATQRTLGSLLAKLWPKRRDGLLTHAAYEEVGRINGVLLSDATQLLQNAHARLTQPLRRILTRLVSAGSSTRMVVSRDDVLIAAGGGNVAAEALTQLISWNVVTPLPEGRVQLASEGFIARDPLAGWLREDSDDLKRQAELAKLATIWRDRHKSSDLLLGETLLKEHEASPLQSEVEREYLEASNRRVQIVRLVKRGGIVALICSLIIIALLINLAYLFKRNSQLAAANAELKLTQLQVEYERRLSNEKAGKERSQHYLELAKQKLAPENANPRSSVFALFYLSIATRLDPENAAAVTMLCDLLARHDWCPPITPPLRATSNSMPFVGGSFSPDGTFVFAISQDGRLWRWNSEGTSEPVLWGWTAKGFAKVSAADPARNSQQLFNGAFSPGGKYLLIVSAPAPAKVESSRSDPRARGQEQSPYDAQVFVWRAESYEPAFPSFKLHDNFRTVAWAPDGLTLITVAAKRDGSSQVFRVKDGKYVEQFPSFQGAGISSAEFSPNGAWLATAAMDGKIELWDAQSFSPPDEASARIKSFSGPRGGAFMLVFGPGKDELAEFNFGRPVLIWNLTDGKNCEITPRGNDQLMRFVLGPESSKPRRILASYGNRVMLCESEDLSPVAEPICPQDPYSVPLFSPDGKKVLTLSGTFWPLFDTARVWSAELQPALANSDKIKFDGKSPPPWLADLAEVVSGQRVISDEDAPPSITLQELGARSAGVQGQYELIWNRFLAPFAASKK
jgi:WD40 repeat protein